MKSIPPDTIVITGLGMISSIGYDVITSCASARAGITRPTELPNFNIYSEEAWADVPLIGHAITGLTEGFEGIGKVVRLGSLALSDLLTYANITAFDFSNTGFLLNLSSQYYMDLYEKEENEEITNSELKTEPSDLQARKEILRQTLIQTITELNDMKIVPKNQLVYFKDHAGIITAIQDASRQLIHGGLEMCIVGGIDSYIETDVLTAAMHFGLVKTEEHSNGFVPGEAASFILIETYDTAMARRARIEGILEAPATANESSHRLSGESSIGLGLTEAMSTTMEGIADKSKTPGLLIGNLNGDAFRATEWGYTLVRLSAKYGLGDQPQWYPAASFGETGASTGALGICMGVRAFVRNYSRTDSILLWLSSDNGLKGSLHLQKFLGD
jgi:3-oxoacyl-[acyl-carrier-protein] synthase-1